MDIKFSVLSMKADAYFVKNPLETTNSYTKTNFSDAVDALKLNGKLSVEELRGALKGYDFTSVSTYELAQAGSLLFEAGLIGHDVAHFFTSGRMAYDETGYPAGTDVKFNAIAMFNQMLEERLSHSRSEAAGFHEITRGLTRANHVLAALSYFANSDQDSLAISVEA
ncbi:hypothetical protein ACSFE6_17445 [Pseudomonas baetica]|uniref:hypothetical protein n=1 Tax=Pseudomonas baetica TaxID=674054 RepID=UPI003EF05F6F